MRCLSMLIKHVMGLAMVAAALFFAMPSTAYAESDPQPSLGLSDATVQKGESFDLELCLANNPGIIGATVEVNYDSRLTLTNVTKGDAFLTLDMTKPGALKPGCKIHWDTMDLSEDDIMDGVIATLTFEVPDTAKDGDTYFVSAADVVTDGSHDVFDRDMTVLELLPASCVVTVSDPSQNVPVTGISLNRDSLSFTAAGQTAQLVATVEPFGATDPTVTWSTDNDRAAIVSDSGVVTAVGSGTAIISARSGGFEATCAVSVAIASPQVSLADAAVTVAQVTYTGVALEPAVTVRLGGITLAKGNDYTVAYANNVNAGTAIVTVTGRGDYTGSKTASFAIAKASGSLDVTSTAGEVLYSKVKKKAQRTASLVQVSGARGAVTIQKVGGSGSLAVDGTGRVTVKKGTKKGTYKATVRVTAAGDANHSAATKDVTVTVRVVGKLTNPMTAAPKAASAKAGKALAAKKYLAVRSAKGKVTYKKAGGNKKIAIAANGKLTVKKGLKAGTYTVKVKVTAAGNGTYNKASKTVTCTIVVK